MNVRQNLLAIYYSYSYLEICSVAPDKIIVISSRELFFFPNEHFIVSYYKDESPLVRKVLNLVAPEIISYYLRDLGIKATEFDYL